MIRYEIAGLLLAVAYLAVNWSFIVGAALVGISLMVVPKGVKR